MEQRAEPPLPNPQDRIEGLGPGFDDYVDLPPVRSNLRPTGPAPIGGILGASIGSAACVLAWRVLLFLGNCQIAFGVGPNSSARTFDWSDWKLALAGIATALPLVLFAFTTRHPTLRFPAMALAVLPVAYVLWFTNGQLSDPAAFWAGRC